MKKYNSGWPKKLVVLTTLISSAATSMAHAQADVQAKSADSKGTSVKNVTLTAEQAASLDGIQEVYEQKILPAMNEFLVKKEAEIQSTFDREFDKAKIDIPIDLKIIDAGPLRLNVRGNRRVSQTKEGEQRRIDVLEVSVGLSKTAFVTATFKISSAKYFTSADIPEGSTKSLKWTALTSKPIRTIPRTAMRVKEEMKVRESLSVEVDGSFGLEKVFSERTDKTKLNLGITASRGATFIIDLSRISEEHVNIRLMGLKNRGEFVANLSGGYSLLPSAISAISNAASIGAKFELGITDRILNRYPVESLIAGYQINIQQDKGIEALDHLMERVGKLDFIPLFIVGIGDEQLSAKLMKELGKLEVIADVAALNQDSNPAVKRLVRAKMVTQNHKGGLELKGTSLSGAKFSRGGSKTYIRYFDPKTKVVKPYLIFNEYYAQESKIRFGGSELRDNGTERANFDFLAHADMNKNATQAIGLISSIEGKQSRFDSDASQNFKNKVLAMLPSFTRENSNVASLLPTGSQHSVFYKVDTIITKDGLKEIGRIPEPNINQAIIDYVNDKNLDKGLTGSGEGQKALHEVTGPMAKGLSQLATGVTTDGLSLNYGELGKHEQVVRFIAPNLFPALLPNSRSVDQMVAVNIEFDSSSTTLRRRLGNINEKGEIKIGDEDELEIYKVINRLRTILNERGFEQRLVDDFENDNVLDKAKSIISDQK